MSAAQGNTYAKKLANQELKEEAFRQYLAHLALGKSKKSWYFEHPELTLTWQTMDTYIRDEPQVFNSLKIECAKCKGYQVWEQVAEDSAKGINKDANTASLQMVMRNKFGWDKEENDSRNSKGTLVERFLDQLDKMDDKKSD